VKRVKNLVWGKTKSRDRKIMEGYMRKLKNIDEQFAFIMHQVKNVAGMLWDKGWAEANAGNLSIDVTECLVPTDKKKNTPETNIKLRQKGYANLGGRRFLITGSGCRFRDIAEHPESGMCIIQISDDGYTCKILDAQGFSRDIRPTSELAAHLLLHEHFRKTGMKDKVVIHTHPTELVALSQIKRFWNEKLLNSMLQGMLPEVKVLIPKGAGLVDYALPGSERLAESTLNKAGQGYRVIIWQKHGCLAVSDSPAGAFDAIDVMNKGAQVMLACLNAGETPEGLNEAEIAELRQAFGLPY
jgi:rhamnulose-1-phosphate aldolase